MRQAAASKRYQLYSLTLYLGVNPVPRGLLSRANSSPYLWGKGKCGDYVGKRLTLLNQDRLNWRQVPSDWKVSGILGTCAAFRFRGDYGCCHPQADNGRDQGENDTSASPDEPPELTTPVSTWGLCSLKQFSCEIRRERWWPVQYSDRLNLSHSQEFSWVLSSFLAASQKTAHLPGLLGPHTMNSTQVVLSLKGRSTPWDFMLGSRLLNRKMAPSRRRPGRWMNKTCHSFSGNTNLWDLFSALQKKAEYQEPRKRNVYRNRCLQKLFWKTSKGQKASIKLFTEPIK